MAQVAAGTRTVEHEGTSVVVAGLVAGVLGGVAMAVFLMIAAALSGYDPLLPLRPLGATFVGPEALSGGHAYLVYGIFVLLAVGALLGILFAALLPPGHRFASGAVIGLGYAWFMMALLVSLVVPAVNPEFRSSSRLLGGSWVIATALYGATFGIVPRLRARLRGRG
jgi:hypothetical protein